MPLWVAVNVTVPAPLMVAVLSVMERIEGFELVSDVIGRLELALTLILKEGSPNVFLAITGN